MKTLPVPFLSRRQKRHADLPRRTAKPLSGALHSGLLERPERVEILPTAPARAEPVPFLSGKRVARQSRASRAYPLDVRADGAAGQRAERQSARVADVEFDLRMIGEPRLPARAPRHRGQRGNPSLPLKKGRKQRIRVRLRNDPVHHARVRSGGRAPDARSGRETSGISSRLTTVRISSSLAQSSSGKRRMTRSMTSET